VAFAGCTFGLPWVIKGQTKPMASRDGVLTGSQRQRGMYMNAGSHDAGLDPDWDARQNKWTGYERRASMNSKPTRGPGAEGAESEKS